MNKHDVIDDICVNITLWRQTQNLALQSSMARTLYMIISVHRVAKMGEIRRVLTTVRTVHIATVIRAYSCTTNCIENTQFLVKAMSTNG